MNSIDLAARPIYRLFLQALLVVVKAVPRAQIGRVIDFKFFEEIDFWFILRPQVMSSLWPKHHSV